MTQLQLQYYPPHQQTQQNGFSQPPPNARKVIENYSYGLNDQIGKGFSSKVYSGRDETSHEPVAIKVIDLQMLKTPLHHSLLQSEIDALSQINHPNVMKLYKVFQTQNNSYLVTEFCDGGDLSSRIEKYGRSSESQVQALVYGVVQGYKELKKRGIIHRDIKPANILMSAGVPKIADFGFAMTPNSPPMLPNVNVGSPLYMSPQALKSNRYSDKSDIWAIGVSAYELLLGQVPWSAVSEKELAQKMLTQPVQFINISLTNECMDFLRRCLIIDEGQRIGVDDMENHPWLRGVALQLKTMLQNNSNATRLHQTAGTHLQNKYFTKIISKTFQLPLGEAQTNTYQQKWITKSDFTGKENSASHKGYQEINNSVNQFKVKQTDIEERQKSISKHSTEQTRQTIEEESAYEGNELKEEETKRNDMVLLSQINFCRYLCRVGQLLLKVRIPNSNMMEDKMQFFVNKNIMIKMTKLRELVGGQMAPMNTLNLLKFQEYIQTPSFKKISQVIKSYYTKYAGQFSQIWHSLQPNHTSLQQDKKFDAIFDENLTEFESFYIILQSVQRQAIRDLTQQLDFMFPTRDPELQIPVSDEDGVVLLDYLVTYFQLTALILDQFNMHEVFAQQSKIEQIAEGKPVRLTYGHFIEIRNKIQQLEI